MTGECCVFKFHRRSVDRKHLMRFQSENAVSNFSSVVWTRPQCVKSRALYSEGQKDMMYFLFPIFVNKGTLFYYIIPYVTQTFAYAIGNSDHSILSGTIISPGSTQLRAKDIKSRLLASKATCIIADSESAEFVDEVICYCCSFTVTPRLITTLSCDRITCKDSGKSSLNLLSATTSQAWSILNPG